MGRLTDNDKKFGPVTYGKTSGWRPIRFIMSSGVPEGDDEKNAHITFYIFGYVFRMFIPNIIKPLQYKVKAGWDPSTVKRMGRDWYYEYLKKEYGFSLNDGFLQLFYGYQNDYGHYTHIDNEGYLTYRPNDPNKIYKTIQGKRWSIHLPWTQLRTYRETLYDKNLNIFHERINKTGLIFVHGSFDEWYKKKEECPTVSFLLKDFDGQEIIAKTYVEEREYKKGEGKFKWLSWFYKPIIHRSLNIEFDKESGKEKGSWKGGTIGCSIEIKEYDNHSSGIQKYCHEEHRSKSGKYKMSFIKELT